MGLRSSQKKIPKRVLESLPKGPLFVGVDTSTEAMLVILCKGSEPLFELRSFQFYSHAKALLSGLKLGLDAHDLDLESVEFLALGIGPGSFTGVRIGAATIKTLSYLLEKPIVTVDSLELLAISCDRRGYQYVAPMIDARKGQVYYGLYQLESGGFKRITGPKAVVPQEAAQEISKLCEQDKCILVGSGVRTYAEVFKKALPDCATVEGFSSNFSRTSAFCKLAFEKWVEGKWSTAFQVEPLYVRASEAEDKEKMKKRR